MAEVCPGAYCFLSNSARAFLKSIPLHCCHSLGVLFYNRVLCSWNKTVELSTCSACLQQDKLKRKEVKKKIVLSRQWKIPRTPHFQPLRELVCQIQDTLVLFKHRGKASVGMTSFHPHPIFLAFSRLGETFVELKGFLVREGSILPSCVMQSIATLAGAWRVAAWPERD